MEQNMIDDDFYMEQFHNHQHHEERPEGEHYIDFEDVPLEWLERRYGGESPVTQPA